MARPSFSRCLTFEFATRKATRGGAEIAEPKTRKRNSNVFPPKPSREAGRTVARLMAQLAYACLGRVHAPHESESLPPSRQGGIKKLPPHLCAFAPLTSASSVEPREEKGCFARCPHSPRGVSHPPGPPPHGGGYVSCSASPPSSRRGHEAAPPWRLCVLAGCTAFMAPMNRACRIASRRYSKRSLPRL